MLIINVGASFVFASFEKFWGLQYPPILSAYFSFLHGLKGKYAYCAGIFIKLTDDRSNNQFATSIDLIVNYNIFFSVRFIHRLRS
jgi:hypothetical protein